MVPLALHQAPHHDVMFCEMIKGILIIISACLLVGSLFLSWHHPVAHVSMKPSELPEDAIMGHKNVHMSPVPGHNTPQVLLSVLPFAGLFLVVGIVFILKGNHDGQLLRFIPAVGAALGAALVLRLFFSFDSPESGCYLALVVMLCTMPVPFVSTTKT